MLPTPKPDWLRNVSSTNIGGLAAVFSADQLVVAFHDAGDRANTTALRTFAIAPEELATRVAEALAAKPGLAVLIRGDRAVDYGKVS